MAQGLPVRKPSFFDRQVNISNLVVFTALALLVGIGIGGASDPLRTYINDKLTNVAPSGSLSQKDFSLYWDVYSKLSNSYVDPSKLDSQQLFYGSIKGMVAAIGDPPTVFYDPTETSDYLKVQSGSYSGIGAELDYVNNQVVVVAPFDGSPAAQAGLEPGDIIGDVNDQTTIGKSLADVVTLIRGNAGTTVKLTVYRPRLNNRKYDLTITRGDVSAPSMKLVGIKDGVATVQISRFTEATLQGWASKWNAIATELKQKQDSGEVKSIVIDLRNNPGGYFDAAIVLASDFLPKGSIVAYQRERVGADTAFPTTTDPRFPNIPVVILVNGSSASASEIFSGAMKYYKRATLVGEKTYGKGTAQIIMPLSDGSSLHVTISKWLLPDKSWINPDNKIAPNQEVIFNYDLKDKGTDNQMDAAVTTAKSLEK